MERILSIQSHVVSGYVGNKAATFPLQVLGYDVDAINTVQFSNHAGYHRSGGQTISGRDIDIIATIMRQNGIIDHTRMLTGYVPDATALNSIATIVADLRQRHGDKFVYLLDPVMGDDGLLYVSPDVVPVYRDILIPLATIITPNWFEVELLTGIEIRNAASLRAALNILHTKHGVPHVVVSSLPLSVSLDKELPPAVHDTYSLMVDGIEGPFSNERLLCLVSSASGSSNTATAESPVSVVYAAVMPRIKGYFSGVGDLFSAMVLGYYRPSGEAQPGSTSAPTISQKSSAHALRVAISKALAVTQGVLVETQRHCNTLNEDECPPTDDEKDSIDQERCVRRMRARELRIIQSLPRIVSVSAPSGAQVRLAPWEEL